MNSTINDISLPPQAEKPDADAQAAIDAADAESVRLRQQARLLTDVGNAARFALRCAGRFLYCPELGAWLRYDDRRWTEDTTLRISAEAEAAVLDIGREAGVNAGEAEAIYKWAAKSQSRARIESMTELAKPHLAVSADKFDTHPWLLNAPNGTLNLKTFALQPHRPEDYLTKLCRAAYIPGAPSPVFDRFLARIFRTLPNLIQYVLKALGYSLTGITTEQVLFFLFGLGQNGKSKLIDAVSFAMGDYALKADRNLLTMTSGEQHPTGQADLKGARLAVVSETGEGRRLDESLVKDLTGETRIKARKLYQDFYEFDMTAKLWLYSNHKPIIRGTDKGIWRRMVTIPFVETIGEEEKDPELGSKLSAEADGILARLVEGCQDWQGEGLGLPTEIARASNNYRVEMDSLGAFLTDRCEKADGTQMVESTELYKAYRDWTLANGEYTKTHTAFSLQMSERGFEKGKHPYTRRATWNGIRLIQKEEDYPA